MRNYVNRLLILTACAIVVAMIPAAATTIPTCADGSLQFYINTYNNHGGCQIGDKIFTNFSYSGAAAENGGNAPTAAGIMVATLGPLGSGADNPSSQFPSSIGLSFTGSWNAPVNGSTADGAIGFIVSVVGGGPMQIEDVGLAQTSGPVLGTGVAAVGEDACAGTVFPCKNEVAVATLQNGTLINVVNDTTFTPTGSLSVSKDITVAAGSNGTAFLSNVQDTFSQTGVPEPRTVSLLLGFGVAAGLVLRKKFQSVQS
jgi:hypothetical protein